MFKYLNIFGYFKEIIGSFSLVQELVQKYFEKQLGKYLETKIQLSLFQQKNIEMHNVKVNCVNVNNAFFKLSPFVLLEGHIQDLIIEIPITNIFDESISISISNIQLDFYYNSKFSYKDFSSYGAAQQPLDVSKNGVQSNNNINDTQNNSQQQQVTELSALVKKILLDTKLSIKNVVIRLFFHDSPDKQQDSEQLYVMLRIGDIKKEKQNKSDLNQQQQPQFFNQSIANPSDYQNSINHRNNSTLTNSDYHNLGLQLMLQQFTIHILKDKHLNCVEYQNFSKSNLIYPFTYPTYEHPTTIFYLQSLCISYTNLIQSDTKKLEISTQYFESILEPYQVKILLRYIQLIDVWKKKFVDFAKIEHSSDQQQYQESQNVYEENNFLKSIYYTNEFMSSEIDIGINQVVTDCLKDPQLKKKISQQDAMASQISQKEGHHKQIQDQDLFQSTVLLQNQMSQNKKLYLQLIIKNGFISIQKDSVRPASGYDEYARIWITNYQNKDNQKPIFNKSIPCSHFILRLKDLNISYGQSSDQQKQLEMQIKSISLKDLTIINNGGDQRGSQKQRNSIAIANEYKINSAFWQHEKKQLQNNRKLVLFELKGQVGNNQGIIGNNHYCIKSIIKFNNKINEQNQLKIFKKIPGGAIQYNLFNNGILFFQQNKITDHIGLKQIIDKLTSDQKLIIQQNNLGYKIKQNLIIENAMNIKIFFYSGRTSQKKDKDIIDVSIQPIFINFDMNILRDLIEILNPVDKFSHFAQQILKPLQIPQYKQQKNLSQLPEIHQKKIDIHIKTTLIRINFNSITQQKNVNQSDQQQCLCYKYLVQQQHQQKEQQNINNQQQQQQIDDKSLIMDILNFNLTTNSIKNSLHIDIQLLELYCMDISQKSLFVKKAVNPLLVLRITRNIIKNQEKNDAFQVAIPFINIFITKQNTRKQQMINKDKINDLNPCKEDGQQIFQCYKDYFSVVQTSVILQENSESQVSQKENMLDQQEINRKKDNNEHPKHYSYKINAYAQVYLPLVQVLLDKNRIQFLNSFFSQLIKVNKQINVYNKSLQRQTAELEGTEIKTPLILRKIQRIIGNCEIHFTLQEFNIHYDQQRKQQQFQQNKQQQQLQSEQQQKTNLDFDFKNSICLHFEGIILTFIVQRKIINSIQQPNISIQLKDFFLDGGIKNILLIQQYTSNFNAFNIFCNNQKDRCDGQQGYDSNSLLNNTESFSLNSYRHVDMVIYQEPQLYNQMDDQGRKQEHRFSFDDNDKEVENMSFNKLTERLISSSKQCIKFQLTFINQFQLEGEGQGIYNQTLKINRFFCEGLVIRLGDSRTQQLAQVLTQISSDIKSERKDQEMNQIDMKNQIDQKQLFNKVIKFEFIIDHLEVACFGLDLWPEYSGLFVQKHPNIFKQLLQSQQDNIDSFLPENSNVEYLADSRSIIIIKNMIIIKPNKEQLEIKVKGVEAYLLQLDQQDLLINPEINLLSCNTRFQNNFLFQFQESALDSLGFSLIATIDYLHFSLKLIPTSVKIVCNCLSTHFCQDSLITFIKHLTILIEAISQLKQQRITVTSNQNIESQQDKHNIKQNNDIENDEGKESQIFEHNQDNSFEIFSEQKEQIYNISSSFEILFQYINIKIYDGQDFSFQNLPQFGNDSGNLIMNNNDYDYIVQKFDQKSNEDQQGLNNQFSGISDEQISNYKMKEINRQQQLLEMDFEKIDQSQWCDDEQNKQYSLKNQYQNNDTEVQQWNKDKDDIYSNNINIIVKENHFNQEKNECEPKQEQKLIQINQLNITRRIRQRINIRQYKSNINVQLTQIEANVQLYEQNVDNIFGKYVLKIDDFNIYDNPTWSKVIQMLKKQIKQIINPINLAAQDQQQQDSQDKDQQQLSQSKFLIMNFIIQKKIKKQQNQIQNQIDQIRINKLIISIYDNIEVFVNERTLKFLIELINQIKENLTLSTDEQYKLAQKLKIKTQTQKKSDNQIQIQQDTSAIDIDNQQINCQKQQVIIVRDCFIPKININLYNDQDDFKITEVFSSQGFLQVINIGSFNGITIELCDVIIQNDIELKNLPQLIMNIWKKQIVTNQKWSIVSNLPGIKNISNLINSIIGVVAMPIISYQDGQGIVKGTFLGVKNLVGTIGQEGINMIEPVYNKVVDKIGIKAKFTGIFNSARSLFGSKKESEDNQNNYRQDKN